MKNKLEQLLNSLIEKGWNVFGHKDRINAEKCNYIEGNYYNFDNHNISISLRELVSKESGLWQFVCENGMINVDETEVYYFWLKRKGTLHRGHYYLSEAGEDIRTNNYQFRIIESSLKDESELEDFLLSNIVIKDE